MITYPRRILMTADTIGGVWTYVMELSSAFEPHGVEVALATMGAPPSAAQRRGADALSNVMLFESRYRLEWMDDPWCDVDRAAGWLLDIESKFKPDIIHLNGYCHGVLPWSAPVVIAAHSCVLSWWRAVKDREAPSCLNEYRRRVAAGLAAAEMVIAPTASMLESLTSNYGLIPRRTVIPNARDSRLFQAKKKKPFIFAAGRAWDESKNLALLDAAAPKIKWPVHLAGSCAHPNGSRVKFENVFPLGELTFTQMAARFAESAIYVLPARYEPFGLSVLEAALCECALVLGDIPSLREVWGESAVFVPPDDEKALAAAVNAFITNESLRAEFARRARTRASGFSPKVMAGRYLAAYRESLSALREAAA